MNCEYTNFLSKHRILTILVITVISIILLSLIIFTGIIEHRETEEIVYKQYNAQQLLLAKQISASIEEFLLQKTYLLEALALNHPNASIEEYNIMFKDIYDGSTGYYSIQFINVSGVVVTGYPENNVPFGYDLYENNREWPIEHIKKTKMTYCTNPLPLFEGGLGSFVWVPIYEGDEYKGAFLGIIKISTLSEKFLDIYNSSGYVYMIDRKGQIIYDGSYRFDVGENLFDILQDSNPTLLAIIQAQVNGSNATTRYVDLNELDTQKEWIIAFAPIQWNRRLWSVGVTTPTREINDLLYSIHFKHSLFVAVSGIITILGGVSLIFLLFKWNQSLELEVKRKTHELRESNKFLENANKKLEELDKLKSDFVAMVSHELKSPLTAIKLSAENLKHGLKHGVDSDPQDLLDRIISNTDRQTRLVKDLLDMAQLESGTIDFKKELVDLREVIEISIETVEKNSFEAGIGIYTNIPDTLPPIQGNKDALISVFVNLMENSMRFTPWGGRIDIIVTELDKYVEVRVKDNGIGIKPEEIDKIFEKFYTLGKSVNNDSGTGLGLPIVKSIIEKHGGTIRVESKEGEGMNFIFRLRKSQNQP